MPSFEFNESVASNARLREPLMWRLEDLEISGNMEFL